MDIATLNKIGDVSNSSSTLAVSIFGGSLAAILSTSYIKPVGKHFRLIYILFAFAWYFLAMSYYYGNLVLRHVIQGYSYFKDGLNLSVTGKANADLLEDELADHFTAQLTQLKCALFCIGVWLLLYLLWFILEDYFTKKEKI